MHTFSETGAGVPAFLAKLWRLVEDPETNNLICWSKDGRSFIIQNQAQFARELLPLNYKHNNMASFIRQLNMWFNKKLIMQYELFADMDVFKAKIPMQGSGGERYSKAWCLKLEKKRRRSKRMANWNKCSVTPNGFHKITSIDNGGLKFDRDEMEFTHPCFKRNCPYLLEHIKRKIASNKSVDEKSSLKPEAVTKVLQDVKAMRGRQDSLDSRFSVMKQENEALWREIASLRQKHAKQQQIVNKLIQFLITIVQPQRNMTSVKRHMQLMINDIPDKSKMRKTSESDTQRGPVIHELSEELLDEVSEVEPELLVPNSPFTRVSTPATPSTDHDIASSPQNIERPQSNVSMVSQNYDFSSQSAEDSSEIVNPEIVAGGDDLVQTVSNDGSKIFYHITEVPDAQPQETTPVSYNEDNVLTTPMVREEMARNQLLRQKNRQRRLKMENSEEKQDRNGSSSSSSKVPRTANQKQMSLEDQQQALQQFPQLLQIKSEQDTSIDPMLFLNVYSNNRGQTPDPNLISPSFNDDSRRSALSDNEFMPGQSADLYNTSSFIANDMPADIFEDNPLLIEDENGLKKELQKFESSTVTRENDTFSSDSTSENVQVQPSTSVFATKTSSAKDGNNTETNDMQKLLSSAGLKAGNFNNMALAKYGNNQELMRLSTADEVSGHLDNVQDELEGLKDLLRSDIYSLDQNTLLGNSRNIHLNQQKASAPALDEDLLNKLFNDSDILGPYGLHLSNEEGSSNGKKGSELTTYQPVYDLSDIINDQNDLEVGANIPTTSKMLNQQQSKQLYSSSVLNTPYHD